MDWFLYDNGLRHERVKKTFSMIVNMNSNYFILIHKLNLDNLFFFFVSMVGWGDIESLKIVDVY